MNRFDEIDNFLKYYAKVFSQNPDFKFDTDFFRYELMNYGLTQEQINDREFGELWNHWMEHFKNSDFEQCYVDTRQEKFLQFRDGNYNGYNSYKLYLSYDKEHMGQAVDMIFDFINDNKIVNTSKVSHFVRSDCICLRIVLESDVKKIIDFINSNSFLRENALQTNPFNLRSGVVGLGFDKILSFNTCLSEILRDYYTLKVENNDLQNVSYDDFADFAKNYGEILFSKKEYISEFVKTDEFGRKMNRLNTPMYDVLANYKIVYDLIGKEVSKTFTVDDYFNIMKYYSDLNFQNEVKQNIKNMVMGKENTESPEKIVNDYLTYATNKYGSRDTAIKQVESYLAGNDSAITRDNNFRNLFNDFTREAISSVLYSSYEYKVKMSKEAIKFTMNKYGVEHLFEAINRIRNNDYSMISNGDRHYRDYLVNYVSPSELEIIYNKYFKDYVEGIIYSREQNNPTEELNNNPIRR